MAIDWELKDVQLTDNDEMVEGKVHVFGSAGPIPVDVTKDFKTKTNSVYPIELKKVPFVGEVVAELEVKLTPPKTVTVSAKLIKPVEYAMGDKAIEVG